MTDSIGLILVDDHTLVREGLVRCLGDEPDFTVLADVGSAVEAVSACRRLQAEVLLAEMLVPGMARAARAVRRRRPSVRVVFLSAAWHDRFIAEALAIEAAGYLAKTEHLSTVIAAIRGIVAGQPYYSQVVHERIVHGHAWGGQLTRGSTLTASEVEILSLLARGLSKKQIADRTDRSVHTVDKHVRHLMDKLNIHDRVGLSRFAIREGLASA